MRDAPFTAVAFGFQREVPMVAVCSCELGLSTGVRSGNQVQHVETNGLYNPCCESVNGVLQV